VRIARYENAQDNVPKVEEHTWPSLVALLTKHRISRCASRPCPGHCAAKNGPAWSPVDITERRKNENVRAITVAVFDLDHLSVDNDLEIEKSSYAYVLHSTHSHDAAAGQLSLRLAMPLSREVLPREWASVRAAAIRELNLPADPATKDLARLYYLPDAPDGTQPFADSREGRPLDVDALLAASRSGLSTPKIETPATSDTAPVDVSEIASLLRRHAKPENRALVARVLKGDPVSPPSDGPYGGQDNALQALMSTCAFVLPNDTPDEAIVHVLRPSFAATDWREGTEHLIGIALDKLRRARERKIERDTKRLAENQAILARMGMRAPAQPKTAKPLDEGAEDPDAWAGRLVTNANAKGEISIKNCEANIELVLRHAPEWRGVLKHNEVKREIECVSGPVDGKNLDVLEVDAAIWFQRSDYGKLGLSPKPTMVRDCIKTAAFANSYDPLRDHLEALTWDGKARADSFLETYFGAEGDPRYLRAVGSKWLISAVARAMRPGEKVDTVLILEGLQGLGKSSAFRALGVNWFSDTAIDITNKDSWSLASQFWILEFAEVKDVRRADTETLKAFLSRNEDTYRPPYGRVNIKVPRRAVFVGTTNAAEYLKHDPTGYRRYWPVKCAKVDLVSLRRDVPQLWAEAVMRFNKGEHWWLNDEEAEIAKSIVLERAEDPHESRQEMVMRWLLQMPVDKRPAEVNLIDVEQGAFQMSPNQIATGGGLERFLGETLRRLGFKPRITQASGVRRRVWITPDDLRTAPQIQPGQKPSPVQLIASSKAA
jgi:predicted P-loop ATPase